VRRLRGRTAGPGLGTTCIGSGDSSYLWDKRGAASFAQKRVDRMAPGWSAQPGKAPRFLLPVCVGWATPCRRRSA